MNNSGVAVYQIMNYYKIDVSNLIVISDDVSLSPGYLRIRRSGSSGGHNGLNSIINTLDTDNFIRVRIGIGKNDNPDFNMIDWVLGKPSQKDSSDIEKVTNKANEIISILLDNVDSAMNKYNNHEQS
jgi:PTH1 family peptidyl-tRNA hydrolase